MRYLKVILLLYIVPVIAKTSLHHKTFIKAAKQNDVAAINKAIKNKININTQDRNGRTALHHAHTPATVHELIINGAELDIKTFDGDRRTPLYDALISGNRDKAITLILSGAKVNTVHHKGQTPLNWAVENNDYELVFYLIQAGAKVTPKIIKKAETKKFKLIAQLLTEYHKALGMRSSLNKLDKFGLSPMHYAIIENNPIKLNALVLAHGQINLKNNLGQTPLHIAVEKNLPMMIEKLLELFVEINVEDNKGQTPLEIAQKLNLTKITRMLLAHGAQIIF